MRLKLGIAKAGIALCAVALVLTWPHARRSAAFLAAQDDPAQLSELQIGSALQQEPELISRHITDALEARDPDLAGSLVQLAAAQNITLPAELITRVTAAVAAQQSAAGIATRFATGLVTGKAEDGASLSGTVAGDLFVFGDIRDVVREGTNLATGAATDRVVLGLAAAGIAITAATYVTLGGAAPVRAGLTLVKDARKVGRLGGGLATWTSRSAREVVDAPALQRAVAGSSFSRPAETLTAVKAAFRAEKAGGLMRLAKNVGRIGDKAGTRGALDTLKIAEGPKDVARAARLAEAKGGQTRAFLKILGRGALLLTTGAWNFAWWIFGALITLFGLVTSLKAGVERMTQASIDRGKARRAKRLLAEAKRAQRAQVNPSPVAAALSVS
ncbi:hypothetical protein ACTZWT_07880 [Rhodopseudomonas sp. NSM]|uniref:hypothetical protein n=1 Tax=Rhodopseudomonas sp. NSM TaxID=3457630 RepID=UPI004036A4D7